MSDLEEREIFDYVESQRQAFGLADEEVDLVQRVGRRRVGGVTYSVYDVRMSGGSRWWVIDHHTNLYSQEDFKSIDSTLTHHIGLMAVTYEQFRVEPRDEEVAPALKAWRRYSRAVDAMAEAEEAEDFQSVGIRCREAMIALGSTYVDAPWVAMPPEFDEPPKSADAKGWLKIYAYSLCNAPRQRAYVRALVEKSWDATVALQHDSNATEWDAEIVLTAIQAIFQTFTSLLTKKKSESAPRCPNCDSYRLAENSDCELLMQGGQVGKYTWDECESCGWKSEQEWDNWDVDRLKRAADYLSGDLNPPKRTVNELNPDLESNSGDDDLAPGET